MLVLVNYLCAFRNTDFYDSFTPEMLNLLVEFLHFAIEIKYVNSKKIFYISWGLDVNADFFYLLFNQCEHSHIEMID